MAKTGVKGATRIINAMGYSWLGIKAAYQHEAAFRQELGLLIFLIPVAIIVGKTLSETLILISSLIFILLVEIINSAIEAVVDRLGDEIHPLSGRAKDMGSAAVFFALVITALIWAAILLPG